MYAMLYPEYALFSMQSLQVEVRKDPGFRMQAMVISRHAPKRRCYSCLLNVAGRVASAASCTLLMTTLLHLHFYALTKAPQLKYESNSHGETSTYAFSVVPA